MIEFPPGDAAQIDFGAGPKIMDTDTGEIRKTWIFVMTLAWSRDMYAELIWGQSVATWLACHRRAFQWFNGLPTRVIIDNPKCAITKACYHDPEVHLLKPLPDVPPELAVWSNVKVHGDCHVQFEQCRYSVPHTLVHQSLWLRASDTSVRIYQAHALKAIHPRLKHPGDQ